MKSKIIDGVCTLRNEIILLSGKECEYLSIQEALELIDKLTDATNNAIDYGLGDE